MIRQCFLAKTGIQFHRDSFKDIGLDVNTIFPVVLDRPPALKPSASDVADFKPTSHAAEPTDGTLTDDVPASPTAASTFKTEEDEELADALSPIYDELKLAKGWWTLEILPLRYSKQRRSDASWESYWAYVMTSPCTFAIHTGDTPHRMNMGRAREIPKPLHDKGEKVLVHRSVKIKIEAEGQKGGNYVPRAKFDHLDFEWVD